MTVLSYGLADGLYLASQNFDLKVARPAVPPNRHHIIVEDCSGSMYGELPKHRAQLKNKLPSMVKQGDTVSIIWFSGRGEFGVLAEAVRVEDARDLQRLNEAIDRFLQPLGLTGFRDPLLEVFSVTERIMRNDAKGVFSMWFMSDGYDNQSSQKEILDVCAKLAPRLAAATIVEYGWYANRTLLAKMSEVLGGTHIFAENFDRYEPIFEETIRRGVYGAKKRPVTLAGTAEHGFAFTLRDDEVLAYAVENGEVLVPEDVDTLCYLTTRPVGVPAGSLADLVAAERTREVGKPPYKALYALLDVLSQRMLADEVFKVLRVLGDVRLIRQFANCFGKQAYSAFQDAARLAVFSETERFVDGYDPALVPADDAYTVVDVLCDLLDDPKAMLHTSHKSFDYQRIGRQAISANDRLSEDERAEIAEMTAKAKTAADLAAVQKRMAEIAASKPATLTFKQAEKDAGVPFSNLTFNEDRPNVSVLTRQDGTVDLPENAFPALPAAFPTYRWRNYTVIKDGILNMKVLPVSIGASAFALLQSQGLVEGAYDPVKVYEIDLGKLPIINRKMVKKVSADAAFRLQYELAQARAAQKVFKHYQEQRFPKERSEGLKAIYGEEAAAWLKDLGITDGGFAPKTVLAESTDFYIGKELKIALKGLSSLPKVDAVEEALASNKKMTPSLALMAPYVKEFTDFVNGPVYRQGGDVLLRDFLDKKVSEATAQARSKIRQLAEIKFSITVGQVWFTEFSSLDEGTLEIDVNGTLVTGTATLREVEVKI